MTDLLNLFREKADEFLATINQRGGVRATIEGLRRQMAEADRRRAMSRVKSELRRLDQQIAEMITAVGGQAVALQEAGRLTSPELKPLCQHIIDLKATLSEQQAELAALEAAAGRATEAAAAPAASTVPSSNCGRPVPVGGTFCPYCGARVVAAPSPAPAAGAEAAEGATSSVPPTPPPTPPPAAQRPAPPPSAPSEQGTPPSSAGRAETPPEPQTAATPPPTATQTACAFCGAPLKPGAKFCSKCGRAV